MAELFDWVKPSLLWQQDGQDFRQPDFFRPQLLEFGSDNFMDDFFVAAGAPKPNAFQKAVASPQPGQPLKLFQPSHGRFYLACGSLCCRLPGFPDREIEAGEGESVFFVLRKLIAGNEYAWVAGDAKKGWQPLNGQARQFMEGEERQPLAATVAGNGRSLVFGYLPVASRESYNVPPNELAKLTGDAVTTITDARLDELQARFIDQLRQIPSPAQLPGAIKPPPNLALTMSIYLLLDLWEFLAGPAVLPDVAEALRDNPDAAFSGEKAQAKSELITFLKNQKLGGLITLASALEKVAQKQKELNQPGGADPIQLGFNEDYNLRGLDLNTKRLNQRVQAALSPATQPSIELPKIEPRAESQYVLRCVYERPQCEPIQRIISQPTRPFQLAPFFDPDAPVRPVKIPLPTDVSIAAMRKFKKGVTFMISDAMQKKIKRIEGKEKKLLEDPPAELNAEENPDGFAFICSFSIEIIFIVAFFLLLMFVIILNLVFWWILFFRICLPIPKKLLPG